MRALQAIQQLRFHRQKKTRLFPIRSTVSCIHEPATMPTQTGLRQAQTMRYFFTVAITAKTDTRITGTFSGELVNVATQKASPLTDGKFDLPLTKQSHNEHQTTPARFPDRYCIRSNANLVFDWPESLSQYLAS